MECDALRQPLTAVDAAGSLSPIPSRQRQELVSLNRNGPRPCRGRGNSWGRCWGRAPG